MLKIWNIMESRFNFQLNLFNSLLKDVINYVESKNFFIAKEK